MNDLLALVESGDSQHCRKIFDQEVDEAPPESIVELYEDIRKEVVLSHNKAKMALSSKSDLDIYLFAL